ncbi:DnaJ domain-containing protein [Cardinium endosymbiont of Philonthus spinipes]|uniref:DnaJ domain-containing protein n=1 Tax=Cardinium endosymbiont of Philonthus spinipes TaxID=3077941 RepID=UPI00313DFC32
MQLRNFFLYGLISASAIAIGYIILTYTTPKVSHSQESKNNHKTDATLYAHEIDEAYKTLGIHKHASYEEARQAFNKLARKYHPDKNLEKQHNCAAEFDKVKKAWDLIGPRLKRHQPD